jgi:DNA-binding NarL/FixJ family response regulator
MEDFMKIMRVLLVSDHSLLMDSVESLLGASGQFEVGSTTISNLADLSRGIEHLKPNIVIIDEAMTFIKPAHLFTFLPDTPEVRLILINSRTSRMVIYNKNNASAPTVNHFLDAIRHETVQHLNKNLESPTL